LYMEKNTMPSHDQKLSFAGGVNFSLNKFASLESTNLFLKTHLTQYPDFSVVVTDYQTGGRGRFERKWQSVSGRSLTFSLKVPLENINTRFWGNITQVMALSVAILLEKYGLKPQIRWPNDILVDGVKICGILAEAVPLENGSWMVLGVGLNVNEERNDFFDLDRAATSLLIETGKRYPVDEILDTLLSVFSGVYSRFVQYGFGDLVGMISKRLYKPDGLVQVIQGNDVFEGSVFGITERGTVLIETQTGVVEVVSGEITSHAVTNK